jgi:dTMP kinase
VGKVDEMATKIHQGIFLVLEGADGSGKATQFELLQTRLKESGYEVAVFDFPRYDQPSSYFVKKYLNGDYGPAVNISPYTASLFYALDRFEAAPQIRNALAEGKIVLSNRYVGSNMAHQGSKFNEPIEKRSFFVWEDSMEFQLLNIPRPDINLYLRVPAEISYELISRKAERSYTKNTHDEHEKDIDHLKRSIETYDLLCQLFPRDFKAIECAPSGRLMTIEEVSEAVWSYLSPLLPPLSKPVAAAKVQPSTSDFNELTWPISRLSKLAAMDLRLFGADVKTAPSWQKKNYEFYTPEGMSAELRKRYGSSMREIAELHKKARQKLESAKLSEQSIDKLLRPAVPLGAVTRAKIVLDKRTIMPVLMKIKASPNPEVTALASQLESVIQNTWPELWKEYKNSDSSKEPASVKDILGKLTQELLPQSLAPADEPLKLTEANPRNELELLVDGLYSYSNLSRPEIAEQIERWNYQQKYEGMRAVLKKPGSEILSLARYRYDFLTDWLTLTELIRLNLVCDVQTQPATPRYGYDVSENVSGAGIDDEYMDMFDKSLELFSNIQAENDNFMTQYAVLEGHRLRWHASIDASSVQKIRVFGNMQLFNRFVESIKEVHPIIGEHIGTATPEQGSQPTKSSRRRRNKPKKS